MTAARQERKPAIFPRLFFGIAVGAGILAPFSPSWAATDNQLAVNATTGLAISGFDPVAYYRGAFEKNPEVYAPQFGGYDPVAIGRGRSFQGIP
jgi:hypothetical protein